MSMRDTIFQRMDQLGIQPKRSLGQNFLVSETVISRIIQSAQPEKFEQTVEIGPGLGSLTDLLKEKAKDFFVIDLDQKFAEYWRGQGVTVHEQDALKFSWQTLAGGNSNLLVSNLPYQISSRLVVDLSIEHFVFHRMVLMFQKEVAQRMTAEEGTADYGLLTVVVQAFWDVSVVTDAGSVDFHPKPNVGSRVLKFERKAVELASPKEFLNLVKLSFANRRKKLLPKLTGYRKKEELESLFTDMGLRVDVRAEKLTVEQFLNLYKALKKE